MAIDDLEIKRTNKRESPHVSHMPFSCVAGVRVSSSSTEQIQRQHYRSSLLNPFTCFLIFFSLFSFVVIL